MARCYSATMRKRQTIAKRVPRRVLLSDDGFLDGRHHIFGRLADLRVDGIELVVLHQDAGEVSEI